MDPVLSAGHVGGVGAQAHCLNEWLDEGGGLFADDVCAEEFSGSSLGDDFAESFAVFHGPAAGDVAVVLYFDRDVEAGVAGLRFGHAYLRDLWVGEDGGGQETLVEGLQRRGVIPRVGEQVLSDHAGFVVGDVFELELGGHVAECVDTFGGGASEFVDDDPAVVVEFDSAGLCADAVTVGGAGDSDEQCIAQYAGSVG